MNEEVKTAVVNEEVKSAVRNEEVNFEETEQLAEEVKQEPSKEKKSKKKKGAGFWIGLLVGVLISFVVVLVTGAGVMVYRYFTPQKEDFTISAPGTFVDDLTAAKMMAIEQMIENYYYLEQVGDEALQNGVFKGLLEALGDPYSVYYSAEELEDLMQQTEGIYYGIGAYVGLDTVTGLPKIISPIPGSPAEEVGLRSDDIIYEVNGKSVAGMELDAVVGLIKGEEGTSVKLTIVRDGEDDYLYLDVERRKVESPTVEYTMLEDGMAHIAILEFDAVTVDQFADALASARADGMKGLILDVRANPGGSLNSVLEISRMLLPKGMIVYTEDKQGNREEYTCDGKNEFDLPLVLLIDGNSASASEILAGAIQDYGIGTLVGTTTYGKGIVQQIISLIDGSAVKLTISAYFTPKGRNIHEIGVEPDLVCEFDGEAYYNEGYDNQLEYAKEVLAGLMAEQ